MHEPNPWIVVVALVIVIVLMACVHYICRSEKYMSRYSLLTNFFLILVLLAFAWVAGIANTILLTVVLLVLVLLLSMLSGYKLHCAKQRLSALEKEIDY